MAKLGDAKDKMDVSCHGAVVVHVERRDPPQEPCEERAGVRASTEPGKSNRAGLWSDRSGYNEQRRGDGRVGEL